MGRFVNDDTKVVISVDDSKDERYADGWSSVDDKDGSSKKAPAKKSASSKSNS